MVSDTDSEYDGTHGEVLRVYDDRVLLELKVWFGGGTLTSEFAIDQVVYPE